MVAENCSRGGGGGAAVDSEEMNEKENGKNRGGGGTVPGISRYSPFIHPSSALLTYSCPSVNFGLP